MDQIIPKARWTGVDQFQRTLNALLTEVYHYIIRIEEQTLRQSGKLQLSINEMHIIDCVGKGASEGLTIRELAEDLDITSPSVTVAVQKLESKGYVEKVACKRDGRAVRVLLTRAGKRVNGYHGYYHRMMTKALAEGMDEAEQQALLSAVKKLIAYFAESIEDTPKG